MKQRVQLSLTEWREKGQLLYGDNPKLWRFKCCSCGGVQTMQDFIDAGIEEPNTKFFFSCIGRWAPGRGCNWTLGGFLQFHETEVLNEDGKYIPVFEFAEEPKTENNKQIIV